MYTGIIFSLIIACVKGYVAKECETWYDTTKHGSAFRSVRDFGAKGDGESDDTSAIQKAIDYKRGNVGAKLPAVVYIPPGKYIVSDTIVLPYYTEFLGNFACPPELKLAQGAADFDGKRGYKPMITTWNGFNTSETNHSWWLDTVVPNLFFVQLRHLKLDLGGNPGAVGLLWGVAQQTAVRDLHVNAVGGAIALDVGGGCGYVVPTQNKTVCHGAGGGGVVEDVVLRGGRIGLRFAASQWFFRGITISGSETCLENTVQAWSFVFLNLDASNCAAGFSYGKANDPTGSVTIVDSSFSDITNGSAIVNGNPSKPFGGLYLSRVKFEDVDWAVEDTLRGGFVESWASGVVLRKPSEFVPVSHIGAPYGPLPSRPRPTFQDLEFLNVLDHGAFGDGVEDDTYALQAVLNKATSEGKGVFFPFGTYKVTLTLKLPASCTVVGEGLARIEVASGTSVFGSCDEPEPVLLAPNGGVTLTGISVTSGTENCAVLLDVGPGEETQIFDVLPLAENPTHTLLLVRGPAYVDNVWGWSADHSLHDWSNIDPPIESWRGLHAVGEGPMYFYGTCFEHHLNFQYSFESSNFTVLQLQTENPYYGPHQTTSVPVHVPPNATGVLAGLELLHWFDGVVPAGIQTTGPSNSNGSLDVFGMFTVKMAALVDGDSSVPLPPEGSTPFKDGTYWSHAVVLPEIPVQSTSLWMIILVGAITVAILVGLVTCACRRKNHEEESLMEEGQSESEEE